MLVLVALIGKGEACLDSLAPNTRLFSCGRGSAALGRGAGISQKVSLRPGDCRARKQKTRGVLGRLSPSWPLGGSERHRFRSGRGVYTSYTRDPFLLETSVPGIFAAGDVRHGVVRRVATSVGQGAAAISFVHKYLETV